MTGGGVHLFSMRTIVPCAYAEDAPPILELHQLNLGYADGYYLRCGDIEIMIDGGNPIPFSRNDDVMNSLRALGAKKLDMYIVTHWHLDHCEKFNEVLAAFGTPDTVVYSPAQAVPKTLDNGVNKQRSLAMLPMAAGVHQQMKQGDVVPLGPLTIHCIGPSNGGRLGRTNHDSLNFVVQYGERRMLFTGDYAASGNINKVYPELCSNVDVLKFPHHGDKPFQIGKVAMRTANPRYILVPGYIHPTQIMSHAGGCDIKAENILTIRDGHIVILTDGGDYIEARTNQNPADYAPN